MIDGERGDAAAARMRPLLRQERERHAVGATGHGDGKMRRGLERRKALHQFRKLADAERMPIVDHVLLNNARALDHRSASFDMRAHARKLRMRFFLNALNNLSSP